MVEDYPRTILAIGAAFLDGGVVPRVPVSASVAGRFHLSPLPGRPVLAGLKGPADLPHVPPSDLRDCRHDLSEYAEAAHSVVPSHLVRDQSKERNQRGQHSAHFRPAELSDSMDLDAQAEAGDGPDQGATNSRERSRWTRHSWVAKPRKAGPGWNKRHWWSLRPRKMAPG